MESPKSALLSIRSGLADLYASLQAARCATYRMAFLKNSDSPGWMTEATAVKLFVVPTIMEIVEKQDRFMGPMGLQKS